MAPAGPLKRILSLKRSGNDPAYSVRSCTEPPSEEQLEKMEAFLCGRYGAVKAKIQVCREESLLGGFILRVGNDEYDWSIKGRLDRLKQKLTWR